MKTMRIECPQCQQPIEIGVASSKVWLWVSIGLFMVVLALSVKIYHDRQQSWMRSLENFHVATLAVRSEILEGINDRMSAMDLDYLSALTVSLQKSLNGGIVKSDEQIKLELLQKTFSKITNDLTSEIELPVKLKGRVTVAGQETAMVESSLGRIQDFWPRIEKGDSLQGGFFLIRNASKYKLQPAAVISGRGTEPLATVFTNQLGERRVQMSYIFTPNP